MDSILYELSIIDLDRPRRGLIRVNQDTMIDLGVSLAEDSGPPR